MRVTSRISVSLQGLLVKYRKLVVNSCLSLSSASPRNLWVTHDRGLLLLSSVYAVVEEEGKANVNYTSGIPDASSLLRFGVLLVCSDVVAMVHCLREVTAHQNDSHVN
jgi:hypothetical protein